MYCVCVLSPSYTHSTDWFLMMIIGSAAVHVYIDYHSIVIHVSRGFLFWIFFFTWSIIFIHSCFFRFNLSGDLCFLLYIQKLCAFFLRRRDESFHVSSHVCFFSSPIRNKNKNGRKKKNMFLRSSFFVCYPCRI